MTPVQKSLMVPAVILGILLGVALSRLVDNGNKPLPSVALTALPGRHLQPPWWEEIHKQRHSTHLITYTVPAAVLFATNSSVIDAQGQAALRGLVPTLAGAQSVLVAGCTDNVGGATSTSNFVLGRSRALAAVHDLESDGLPARLFRVVSWADTHPVAHTAGLDQATIRALNRRLVIEVTK
jgi:outer membrane protein OmpA-like peptidoglycan-associated protein